MKDPILLTPGPTPVPAEVREALGRPMVHHRTPEFQAVLKEVAEGLKQVFRTQRDVYILTSSGTGAMEAAVANLVSPGDPVIAVRGGKFGERWAELTDAYGARTIPFDAAWGKPMDLKALSDLVAKNPGVKAVYATLCETSTGVTYDIPAIRRAIGDKPLLVVDTISGLAAEPFEMDAWGVDVTVSGSQKGLMLPPGLAFIALSERAWAAVEACKTPSYYFSMKLAKKAWEDTDTPFTPAISLIVGLAQALKRIQAVGLDKMIAANKKNAQAIRQAVKALGLEMYTDPEATSNAVTSVKVPAGVDGKELLKRLRKVGIVMAGGQGKELAGKIVRIASMGAIGPDEIRAGLDALEKEMTAMGWKPPQPGAGVKALEAALR